MSNNGEHILTAALALPDRERAEIAARLLESLDGDDSSDWAAAWDAEISQRLRELEGGGERISWPEARRRIAGERDGRT